MHHSLGFKKLTTQTLESTFNQQVNEHGAQELGEWKLIKIGDKAE